MESVHDLLFFDTAKKADQTKFYGVFRTSANLPSVVVPALAAGVISVFGTTSAVWGISAVIGILATIVLLAEKR